MIEINAHSLMKAFAVPPLMCGILLTCVGCSGFGTSRWAMDDPVYAEKYDDGYNSNDGEKVARMIKQSIDARHVADRSGSYFGAAGADEPTAGGIEFGTLHFPGPTTESRIGLKGLLGTGADDWFLGADLGLRVQSPSRIAPFAGLGTFAGGNARPVLAIDDHVDNDGDGSVDERGEYRTAADFMASVYPELGVHFWLNGGTRLTASAQYHLTTDGRDSDFWFIGLSLSFLDDPDEDSD